MWLPLVDQVTAAKAVQQILERDAEKGHQSLTTSETRKKEYEASVAKLTAELAVVTAQMAKLTVDHDRQKIDLATGAAAAADLAAQQKRLEGELVEVSAARDAALAALAEVEEKLKSVEATVTAMEAGGDAQAQDMAANLAAANSAQSESEEKCRDLETSMAAQSAAHEERLAEEVKRREQLQEERAALEGEKNGMEARLETLTATEVELTARVAQLTAEMEAAAAVAAADTITKLDAQTTEAKATVTLLNRTFDIEREMLGNQVGRERSSLPSASSRIASTSWPCTDRLLGWVLCLVDCKSGLSSVGRVGPWRRDAERAATISPHHSHTGVGRAISCQARGERRRPGSTHGDASKSHGGGSSCGRGRRGCNRKAAKGHKRRTPTATGKETSSVGTERRPFASTR
jgi:septal ring factor EnvC (AmiA/AmiB activator)